MSKIKVVGVAGNPELLHFKSIAKTDRRKTYEIQELFESEYDSQMKLLKSNSQVRLQLKSLQPLTNADQFASFDDSFLSKTLKRPLLVFKNGTPTLHPCRKIQYSQSIINESLQSQLQCFNKRKSAYAFMEVQVFDKYPCKFVFELHKEYAPRACENFLAFCEGVKINNQHYSYKNTILTRYQPNGYIQGGQFDHKVSLFGGYFEDESYAIKHDCEGILGLANDGFAHTNTSQFYITLAPFPWFDRKRVAFGKVIQGMKDFQKILKLCDVSVSQVKIRIKDCGRFDQERSIRLKLDKFADDFQTNLPDKAESFRQFIESEQLKHKDAQGDFTCLLKALVECIKQIGRLAHQRNNFEQAKAVVQNTLQQNGNCSLLYIIDNEEVIPFEAQNSKYLVAFRIIDGTDASRGSGLVVFKKQTTNFKQITASDFKQTAEKVVAILYSVYGRTTQLVLGIGYNLTLFTLSAGDFRLSQRELKIPEKETFYSSDAQDEFMSNLVAKLDTKVLRYTDSVFTSLHRTVRLGGLAIYSSVSIFEAIVASFVLQRSWGWAFCDGTSTYNQIRVKELDQRTFLAMGQQKWIQKIENYFLSIH